MNATSPRPVDVLSPGDLDGLVELNAANTPHVNALGRDSLELLVACAACAPALHEPATGELRGAAIVLAPGLDYASPNYRHFDAGPHDFWYLDRILVDGRSRRSGVGRALYRAVVSAASAAGVRRITCEVNVEPPNPVSLAFHRAIGFREVGRLENPDHATTVALMELQVAAAVV